MSKGGRGWHGERARHSAAARGIRTGKKPTLKQIEDLLVLAAERARTDEEYAQLIEAADNIGDLREDVRIMAAKEGEMSGPSGRMPIVDATIYDEIDRKRRGRKASWKNFRKILRSLEDANMLPPWQWTLKDYYEDYLDSGLTVNAYVLNLKEQLRLGPNGGASYGKRR